MHSDEFGKIRLPAGVASGLIETGRRISELGLTSFRNRELYEPASHLLHNSGKLLRPSLVLLGAHATRQNAGRFTDLAVAAELLHISSLIHDDIIDGDETRRGVESVHMKYGEESAILAGDALVSKAIGISAKYGGDVISRMSDSAMDMCAGEALDYSFQKERKVPRLEEYRRIAELKSASLIAVCCSVAAVYKKDRFASRLHSFGMNIGIAFQMRDDILDSRGGREKKVGQSLRPNIVTTLIEYSSLTPKEAVASAIEMHNAHIDKAVKDLGRSESADLLSVYADSVRVR